MKEQCEKVVHLVHLSNGEETTEGVNFDEKTIILLECRSNSFRRCGV